MFQIRHTLREVREGTTDHLRHIHNNTSSCAPTVPFCCSMEVFVFFLSSGGTFTLNLAALNHRNAASSAPRMQYVECVSHGAPKSFHKILFFVSHRLLKVGGKPNRMTSSSKFPLRGISQDWCKQKGAKSNYYLWIRWHFCQLLCVYGCVRAWRPQGFSSCSSNMPARPKPGNMNQPEHSSLGRVRYAYGERELRLLGYHPHMPSALSTSTAKSTVAVKPTRDSYSGHIFEQNFCIIAVFFH